MTDDRRPLGTPDNTGKSATKQPCDRYSGPLCTCYRTACICPVLCEACGWNMWLHRPEPTTLGRVHGR